MKTMYTIFVTNENGDRVRIETVYRTFDGACAASAKMQAGNPACQAAPIKVMCRPNRQYNFAD